VRGREPLTLVRLKHQTCPNLDHWGFFVAFLMKKIVKPLVGYEEKYTISNTGRIKNILSGKFLKPRFVGKKDRTAIYTVDLNYKGKRNQLSLPRLVAQHFVSNPDECICVYHKDGNRQNCHAWNLIWIPNDVVNWLGTRSKGKVKSVGLSKFYGTKDEAIKIIESLKNRHEKGEEFLIDFYKTGEEKYLWQIFELHKAKIKNKIKGLISEEEARYDVLIDSFLYFIEMAKRYAIAYFTFKKWLEFVDLAGKKHYQRTYKFISLDESIQSQDGRYLMPNELLTNSNYL